MSNRIAFQTQLASIMEVLANAAVAEICKLVDDDYAVINLQMTQCQRENKALKRKLHVLELKMARGFAERRISSLNRANRVQVNAAALSDKYRNRTNDPYEAPFNTGLWRGGGTDSVQPTVTDNNSTAEDAVVSEVDTVLIKEEVFEENQTQQRLFIRDGLTQTSQATVADFGDHMVKDADQVSGMQQHTLEQKEGQEPETLVLKEDLINEWEENQKQEPIIVHDVESDTDICSGTLSTSPVKNTVMLGTEELIDLDFSHLRENGLDRCQKTDISPSVEIEIQDVMESSPSSSKQYQYHTSAVGSSKALTSENSSYTNSGHKGAAKSSTLPTNQPMLNREKTATDTSGTNCSLYERPAEHKGRFTRWPSQTATTSVHSSCSYTTDSNQDQDCMLVQSEPVSSASKSGLSGVSSARSHGVRSANATEGPIRDKESWNQAFVLRQSQTEPSGHISRPEAVQIETKSTSNPSLFTMSTQMMPSFSQPGVSLAGMNLPQHIEKGKRKGYVCKFCGKAFPGMSNVVAHQRVHTGERPFRCDICGKLFTEAGNLKKHQRVHTGEKPFVCTRCGKRFAWICNLKTHQQSASCGGV